MKVIITGGAGFIGSHLADAMLARGAEVHVLDNLTGGRKENLSDATLSENMHMHEVDCAEYDQIAPLFCDADWVFHLAGMADIVPSIRQPLQYHRANAQATANVLEASRQSGVSRFVYAASSSCYGFAEIIPTPETAPIRPQYPYALTKYQGEELVQHWHQTYGLQTVSLRLFNVYGPRSRTTGAYGAVFGVFLAQKLAGVPYTVVGDGTQTRDFIYVSDVVNAFIQAADSSVTGKCFNVGAGAPQNINTLVKLLGGEAEYIPKRPGEPEVTHADITNICRELNWKPIVSFEEGVGRMLASISLWKNAPVWNRDTINEATADWFRYLDK